MLMEDSLNLLTKAVSYAEVKRENRTNNNDFGTIELFPLGILVLFLPVFLRENLELFYEALDLVVLQLE